MHEKLDWLFDYATYVRCDWPHTIEEALCKDSITGHDMLTKAAKVQATVTHVAARRFTDMC
jgi:hypothetical protein